MNRTNRIIQAVAATFLAIVFTVALVSLSAPAPWSPLGQAEQASQQQDEAPTFKIPPGYEPAVPTTPAPAPGAEV